MKIIHQYKYALALAVLLVVSSTQLKAQTTPVNAPIKMAPILNASQLINMLKPVYYRDDALLHVGFEATSVRQNMPYLMSTDNIWINKGKNNQHAIAVQKVDMLQLIPVLVATAQEQQTEIIELKKQIAVLKEKVGN